MKKIALALMLFLSFNAVADECSSLGADEELVAEKTDLEVGKESGLDYAEVFELFWLKFVHVTGCHEDSLEMYVD